MDQRTVGRISRWIAILCAFILAMAMGITVWATAEPGTTIYIVDGKQGVNIRSQASTDSEPVGKLDGGAALTVISVVSAGGNNWYQVECVINGETKTGYIREDLVKIPENGAPAEAGDPAGEGEGGETAPEGGMPVPEEGGGFSSDSKLIGELQFMDSKTEPEFLPEGFIPQTLEMKGVQFPAWSDGKEYYIFYAAPSSGIPDWYMYDSVNKECVRYRNFMAGTLTGTTVSSNGDGVSKTAFIIVVVFCVALVAATTVMGIKLMNGGGRDDYDDDDDYEDEEDEGPRVRKSSVFRKFTDEEEDYEEEEDEDGDYDDGYDDRRSSGRQAYQRAVQSGTRIARSAGESRQPVQNRPASGGRPAGQQGGMARPSGQQPARPSGQQLARPSGQQPTRPAGQQPARPTGQQPARPSGGAVQGQQRYVQRQAGQQRYAQRTTTARRDDDGEY